MTQIMLFKINAICTSFLEKPSKFAFNEDFFTTHMFTLGIETMVDFSLFIRKP